MTTASVRHPRARLGRFLADSEDDGPESDALDEADRELLHASLDRAAEQLRAGKGIPAGEAMALLRKPAAR